MTQKIVPQTSGLKMEPNTIETPKPAAPQAQRLPKEPDAVYLVWTEDMTECFGCRGLENAYFAMGRHDQIKDPNFTPTDGAAQFELVHRGTDRSMQKISDKVPEAA